ncbi:hypothetical protein ABDI49_21860 [Bacillus cereus]
MEMLHNEKYGGFTVSEEICREIGDENDFMFVQHSADGTMVATDSHRLCRIKNNDGFDKDYLVNPLTFEVRQQVIIPR